MINPTHIDEQVTLARDVEVITIPFGSKTILKKGEIGQITQALGGSYTVMIGGNLYRIDNKDADAIGKEILEELDNSHEKENGHLNEQAVWDAMKTCYDPEIPVNVVDLGLIYDLQYENLSKEQYYVKIKMTLTTPNCPVAETLPVDVEDKVKTVKGIKNVEVEITFDPPWTQDLMSEEAKLELGIL